MASTMDEPTLERLALFLRDLGQALHVSGAPAHDLERTMSDIGQQLGVHIDGLAVLTFFALNIVAGKAARRVEMLRLPPYDYNMARLVALQALTGEITDLNALDDYAARLAAIMQTPAPWSGWRSILMGFLLSGSVALLLRGGWVEMLCGGLIGMGFLAGHQLFARIPRLGPAAPVVLCALAAMAAQGLAHLLPQQTPFISAVAGVVYLLPGFMLTVAMSELATQNYLAGTGRLTGAFVLLFLMGAGLAIGTKLALAIMPATALGTLALTPGWLIWPAIAALGISLLAVLQAPWSALLVSAGGCLLAWAVYSVTGAEMGSVVGAFAGAVAVSSAGHLYHFISGKPAVLVQTPGLITLVPGSMGFRGVHALIEQDSLVGIGLVSDMLLTGAVLAVGLLLADNILPLLFGRRGASLVRPVPEKPGA